MSWTLMKLPSVVSEELEYFRMVFHHGSLTDFDALVTKFVAHALSASGYALNLSLNQHYNYL